MLAHLDTEAYLHVIQQEHPNDFSFTVVRIAFYSESFDIYTSNFDINDPPSDGKIQIPHDGTGPGIAWAKRSELGEAMAILMAKYIKDPEHFAYLNKLIVLSGPRSYSLQETAKVISNVVGQDIYIEEVPVDVYARLPHILVNIVLYSLISRPRLSSSSCCIQSLLMPLLCTLSATLSMNPTSRILKPPVRDYRRDTVPPLSRVSGMGWPPA